MTTLRIIKYTLMVWVCGVLVYSMMHVRDCAYLNNDHYCKRLVLAGSDDGAIELIVADVHGH
jgi:hypothetical protein